MRFQLKSPPQAEGDMTPMIDMTFQLICFFMVALNFSEADQDERIRLPSSELARPAEAPFDYPIFVQLTRDNLVLLSGQEVPLSGLKPYMVRESEYLKLNKRSPAEAAVIIRADGEAPMGTVQEVIQVCQECEFETFALRAQEEKKYK
jgi:biopolymer transport protein ExbD